jgi:predicted DNA-binding antitoxin AbrB/MazE fold protein
MSVCIEALYEGGMLKPLEHYDLKEHKHYRLMLLEEIQARQLAPNDIVASAIAERTITLADGRTLVDILGIFQLDTIDLSFEIIEAALNEFRQQHEWHDVCREMKR